MTNVLTLDEVLTAMDNDADRFEAWLRGLRSKEFKSLSVNVRDRSVVFQTPDADGFGVTHACAMSKVQVLVDLLDLIGL